MVPSSDLGFTSELYRNARRGNRAAIAKLEKEANEVDDEGATILHRESRLGNEVHVRIIVEQFANKNFLFQLDRNGHTALHIAVLLNNFPMVYELVHAALRYLPLSLFEAFIRHVTGQGRNTALLAILQGNNADMIWCLALVDSTYIHIPNDDGKTPIYIAALKGYINIVKMLTVSRSQSLDGPDGRTTVLHALIDDDSRQVTDEVKDMIRVIIHAAKRWSIEEDPPHVFETLFNKTDESGRTLLELAMEKNYVNVAALVLQEDLAYQRGANRHSLMRLIYKAIDKKFSEEIVKLLSETYEAGIRQDHKGVVKLILAIKSIDRELVSSLLLDAKELVRFADDEGWTPLHYATYHDFDSILEFIIKAQKDIDYTFVYGDGVLTPLLVAAERGHTSTMIRLMQLWPSSSSAYTAVNKKGRNILHIAATENKNEMIQGILMYCPQKYKDEILKQQDEDGNTPLHLLIAHGCFVLELIKHKGLDMMAENKQNWTPPDMLYLNDDIIVDQVHIKRALDNLRGKRDSSESKVPLEKRQKKDVIFNERTKLMMNEEQAKMEKEDKENLEMYKKRTSTQIVATATTRGTGNCD